MWPFSQPEDAFRSAVRQEFGALANECGSSLRQIEPLIFGFVTDHAVLTVGAYPGHFIGICVKLRRRIGGEKLSVDDASDIGLAVVEEFASGSRSDIYTKRQLWAGDQIREEVEGLASAVRRFGLTFVSTPNGDWDGLRAFVQQKIDAPYRAKW